jgi:hypothetical protein
MYAYVTLTTIRRAPLLAVPRLRRLVCQALLTSRADAPGALWAYALQPCTVRLVVGPTDGNVPDTFVTQIKARLAAPLLRAILGADDETLDAVLHYNPVWGGAIYRVWEAGYHYVPLWNAYRLSQAVYGLRALRDMGAEVWLADS